MDEGDAIAAAAILKQLGEWNGRAALHRELELLVGRSKELRSYCALAARCVSLNYSQPPVIACRE